MDRTGHGAGDRADRGAVLPVGRSAARGPAVLGHRLPGGRPRGRPGGAAGRCHRATGPGTGAGGLAAGRDHRLCRVLSGRDARPPGRRPGPHSGRAAGNGGDDTDHRSRRPGGSGRHRLAGGGPARGTARIRAGARAYRADRDGCGHHARARADRHLRQPAVPTRAGPPGAGARRDRAACRADPPAARPGQPARSRRRGGPGRHPRRAAGRAPDAGQIRQRRQVRIRWAPRPSAGSGS